MADKRSKTNKTSKKSTKQRRSEPVRGTSSSRRTPSSGSRSEIRKASSRTRQASQRQTPQRTRTASSYYGSSGRTSYGADSRAYTNSRSSSGSGRNVININDVRKSRGFQTSGRTNLRPMPQKSSQRITGVAGRASRTSAAAASESASRRNVNTGSERTRQVSKAQRPQNRRVVHKKVSGLGYEGAARVFMVLFILLAAFYIGGNILRYAVRTTVSYDTIQIGSIDTPKSAEGLIVREETAYQSDIDGEINFLVPSEEKVKTGEVICTVKLTEAVAEAEQSINEINDDIINSETVRQEVDETSEGAVGFNLELKALADEAAMSFVVLDTEALRDFTNNAQVKQETRNQSIISSSTSRSAEKQQAEIVIAENSRTYTALEGGIVCLETDGLEDELKYETIGSLSENDIKQSTDSSHVAGSEVSAGENIFKIITSNVWYIAAYIDSDYVLDWEQGDRRTIYLTDSIGQSIEMDVVVEAFVPDSKTTYLVLRASKYMTDFMSSRNLTFEIDKVQTGYKIANTSIVENTLIKIPAEYVENGTVTKQNGTTVSVGEPNGDYAYFPVGYDALVLHDIILNPDDHSDAYELTEVEARQGVYIMNTGIAEFYTIDMEGSSSNSTHTILDPVKNTNLSVYDRVVVDPKNIEADDMLYK